METVLQKITEKFYIFCHLLEIEFTERQKRESEIHEARMKIFNKYLEILEVNCPTWKFQKKICKYFLLQDPSDTRIRSVKLNNI